MRIILNADDFGKTHESNLGVTYAMQYGFCSQTSVMVNSNYLDEAIDLAQKYDFMDKVGLHINLFEGTPLSKRIRSLKHYARYDMFDYRPDFTRKYFAREVDIIRDELEAQIQKYLQSGFTSMNIDSHHCAFYDMSVLEALLPLLKKYQFQSMRFIGNSYFNGSAFRNYYGHRWLQKIGDLQIKHPDYSSSVATYTKNLKNKESMLLESNAAEVYVHPVLIGHRLIDDYTGGRHIPESFKACGLDQEIFITSKEI
ncbi:ChbG/HpnK family deacetylase [Absicoccus porci]|uniref:ChbG/HpnK family deacetylase n=1 Tax=Absicoccus porci TaxID=2486576 RepID=UPI002943BAB1|nr:ChbG/HpnK family deacetylase [Absicoccus porci]